MNKDLSISRSVSLPVSQVMYAQAKAEQLKVPVSAIHQAALAFAQDNEPAFLDYVKAKYDAPNPADL